MNTSKLTLAIASVLTLNLVISAPVKTKEIDRDLLCRKFPLNSRCRDYRATKSESKIYQLDRNSFCDRFPLNSKCQQPAVEVITLNLDRSGENDEWIRIEKQGNKVKLLHTTKVKDGFVSGALNGALGFVPFPLPFVEANKYNWEEHSITKVEFESDRCQAKNCTVTGKNSLTLPEESNVYAGLFTIDYQEKDLKRSLSFRIPADTKIKTIDTITVERN